MVEAGLVHRQNDSGVKAIAVSALDPDLLNACLRLVRLLQMPEQYRVAGPFIIREIVYRLLIGEQGHRMCHLTTIGGHAHRIVRAVQKLREDFAEPLRIEDVAREIGIKLSYRLIGSISESSSNQARGASIDQLLPAPISA
jgi:hypothetical protein